MKIGMLAIRDDEDIVPHVMRWHLEHGGLDAFAIVHHHKTAAVEEAIAPFRDAILAEHEHSEPNFQHAEWVEDLRQQLIVQCQLTHYDWLVNLDADEYWTNLYLLDQVSETAWAVQTRNWRNYLPFAVNEFNFTGVKYTGRPSLTNYGKLSKYAVRATTNTVFEMGSHIPYYGQTNYKVKLKPKRIAHVAIDIDHFPFRTFAAFQNKVQKAKEGFGFRDFTDTSDSRCDHWLAWVELLDCNELRHWFELLIAAGVRKIGERHVEPLTEDQRDRLKSYQLSHACNRVTTAPLIDQI